MKTFITNYLKQKPISKIELNKFIIEYCKLCGKKEPDANEIGLISNGIQIGLFDLKYMVNNAIELTKFPLTILFDKNGNFIKYII
jgi:predicted nucleic-acid-binding Zn-ribbon protein